MSFIDEFKKFLGGMVGDENTKSGISINRASDENVKKGTIHVPFSYDKNGETHNGYLVLPRSSTHDVNDFLKMKNNNETIELSGIELDNGQSLTYDGAKKFLNSVSPKDINLNLDSTSKYNGDNPEDLPHEKDFLKNYRNYMKIYNDWRDRDNKANDKSYSSDFLVLSNPDDNSYGKAYGVGGRKKDSIYGYLPPSQFKYPGKYYIDKYGTVIPDGYETTGDGLKLRKKKK